MDLFFLYLRQRRHSLLSGVLFCLIFAVTFSLYHLPLSAVIYPAMLCLLLGAIFLTADFGRAKKKHEYLLTLQKLSAAMMSSFPQPEGIEDIDYQEIIRLMQDEIRRMETAMDLRYTDMIEYYTVWAHQIKTPIAAMRLKLQNEDSPLSRKLSADLNRIEQYVEMVLAYLRLGSTATDYIIKEYDLDAIIRQSVKKYAGEFIGRKIRLEYEPVNATVITDEKWLSFVIEQLLSNALKYTFEGSVKIYLTAPKTLCIEDSGIGIAPEDLPRIFEKGYTGYNGRRDKKASGLGLYLCRSICSKLGHPISASSSLDTGTVIRIDLAQYKLEKE